MITYSPDLLLEGMNALFFSQVVQAADLSLINLLCHTIPTDKRQVDMPKLGDVPQLTEWVGNRKISRLSRARQSVVVRDFQSSITFDRNDLDDDQMSGLQLKINMLAERAANHPISLLIQTINSGTANTTYDGAAMFSTHPARGLSGTFDNLQASSGNTSANHKTDFTTGKTLFARCKDEAGEPFLENIGQLLVIAAPEQEMSWMEVLFANLISTGGSNVFTGLADLYISARITSGEFYMVNIGSVLKPLVFVTRQGLETAAEGLDRTKLKMNKQVTYGVDVRYAMTYAFFQTMIKFS